ncbi:MAG: DUF3006 domain-containing protein [Deltaproteobacteria bacterium]|nr:DUF3006 domain-containing protein [Deltaproteobacteria bacterium]
MRAWGWGGVALAVLAGCSVGRTVLVVDRVEAERVQLLDEDGEVVEMAPRDLPDGVREGDVLVDGHRDESERARRLTAIRALRQSVAGGREGPTSWSLEQP